MSDNLQAEVGKNGVVSIGELKKMTFEEIGGLEKSFRKARKEEFYDSLVVDSTFVLKNNMKHDLFRKGINQKDTPLGQENNEQKEYQKTELHTNMTRDGEFPYNTAFIVTSIEAPLTVFGGSIESTNGVASGLENGIVINPAINSNPNCDPAVIAWSWLNQNKLTFKQNETEGTKGLLREFPSQEMMSGGYGASPGAFIQNSNFNPAANLLQEPIVLVGNEDFFLQIETLAPSYDLRDVKCNLFQRVVLRGVYLYELR